MGSNVGADISDCKSAHFSYTRDPLVQELSCDSNNGHHVNLTGYWSSTKIPSLSNEQCLTLFLWSFVFLHIFLSVQKYQVLLSHILAL